MTEAINRGGRKCNQQLEKRDWKGRVPKPLGINTSKLAVRSTERERQQELSVVYLQLSVQLLAPT
jgi:hypothetical protein